MYKTITIPGYWNKKLVVQAITGSLLANLVVAMLFYEKLVGISFIVTGVLSVSCYFLFVNHLYHRWRRLNNQEFRKSLLLVSFITRVLATVGLYFYYLAETGEPFEYYAVDSKFYHTTAVLVSEKLRQLDLSFSQYLSDMSFSDQGYNLFLGIIYTIFGPSILAARLVNAVFSCLTVLIIYRTAHRVFDQNTARIAGISAMLLPNFMLYLGTHLKETVMVFMIMAVVEQSILFVQYRKRDLVTISSLMALFFLLFMFRTVLATTVLGAFSLYALVCRPPGSRLLQITSTAILLTVFVFLLLNSQAGTEIEQYFQKMSTSQTENMQFRATRDGGNRFALIAGAPIFLSIILIAPFPSLVYVHEQDLLWMFIGANFIRNFYAFFAIAGIIFSVRRVFRRSAMLLFFVGGYLLVLANSGFAISERFHLPAVPFLLIFSAAGIAASTPTLRKRFVVYVGFVVVLVIAWNFIKIAGRV